jgi:hypothetical protein
MIKAFRQILGDVVIPAHKVLKNAGSYNAFGKGVVYLLQAQTELFHIRFIGSESLFLFGVASNK